MASLACRKDEIRAMNEALRAELAALEARAQLGDCRASACSIAFNHSRVQRMGLY